MMMRKLRADRSIYWPRLETDATMMHNAIEEMQNAADMADLCYNFLKYNCYIAIIDKCYKIPTYL